MSTVKTAFYSFMFGSFVGGALALLFAPASGDETRKRIKEGVGNAKEGLEEGYIGMAGCVEEGKEKVSGFLSAKKEDIKEAFEAGKEAYLKGRERLFRESMH